jgi:RNA polymerase sigma-70 factor (ECF subfamily)
VPSSSVDTLLLQGWVKRWQAGDRAAADDLLRAVGHRMELLTRRMLGRYPAVRDAAETADVYNSSLLRLLNALRTVQPSSTRHFFNLAAVQVRRELVELLRRLRGKRCSSLDSGEGSEGGMLSQAEDTMLDDDLELWSRFHEAVEQLPADEREVMSLTFYHGWTHGQIAALFQVDERTIRRWWQAACLQVNLLVGAELPRT